MADSATPNHPAGPVLTDNQKAGAAALVLLAVIGIFIAVLVHGTSGGSGSVAMCTRTPETDACTQDDLGADDSAFSDACSGSGDSTAARWAANLDSKRVKFYGATASMARMTLVDIQDGLAPSGSLRAWLTEYDLDPDSSFGQSVRADIAAMAIDC